MMSFLMFLFVVFLMIASVVVLIKILWGHFHRDSRFSKEFENVIEVAIADGELTEKERAVLRKRALIEGFDPDEFDVIIEEKLLRSKSFFGRHPTTKVCLYVLSCIMGVCLVCVAFYALIKWIIQLVE